MKEFKPGGPVLGIKLPPIKTPTPRELERRRKVVARILERRRRIGPLGIRAEELVRSVREVAERG